MLSFGQFYSGGIFKDYFEGGKIKWGPLTAQIVGVLIAVGAISCLIYIVWASYRIITSAGDQTKLANGRYKLIYALAGLFLVVGAYAIWRLVLTLINFNSGGTSINMGL